MKLCDVHIRDILKRIANAGMESYTWTPAKFANLSQTNNVTRENFEPVFLTLLYLENHARRLAGREAGRPDCVICNLGAESWIDQAIAGVVAIKNSLSEGQRTQQITLSSQLEGIARDSNESTFGNSKRLERVKGLRTARN